MTSIPVPAAEPADSYDAQKTFAELGVAPELVAALSKQGIINAFPIQAMTIHDALAGRDVCGKAKTGSGKTHTMTGTPSAPGNNYNAAPHICMS